MKPRVVISRDDDVEIELANHRLGSILLFLIVAAILQFVLLGALWAWVLWGLPIYVTRAI